MNRLSRAERRRANRTRGHRRALGKKGRRKQRVKSESYEALIDAGFEIPKRLTEEPW